MKIVVVGGSGVIGSRLVSMLSRDGHEVVAVSRRSGVDVVTGEGLAEALKGAAVVVDVTKAASANPDYRVTVADLEAFESANGRIPDAAILLIRTGFSSRWPDAARYLGTAERGAAAVAKLHFPGVSPEAAKWLVSNRKINALGIDTASIDYGQSTMYETHRILYEANIPGLENLNALDRLPQTGASIVALPMKIKGGSGAPLRAIAIIK